MVNHSVLRQSSPVPDSLDLARRALEAGGDSQAGNAPAVREVSGAPSERIARAPENATPESVSDVALALVLNEIAHQARSITNAAGSAVLLIRRGVPVCRSTCGSTARDASAYLSECSGLAWRNGTPQYCHDVETDPRFDLASFRRLGIRSFLIVPVQDDKKTVVAIVQTFSASPQAVNDRDLLALQGLGRHIVDHIETADRTFSSIPKITGNANPQIAPGKKTHFPFAPWFNTAKLAFLRGQCNLMLGVSIIVLAIVLGWTIGRSERESARQNRGVAAAPIVNRPQIAVTTATSDNTRAVQVAKESNQPGSPLNDALLKAKEEQSPSETERHGNRVRSRHSLISQSDATSNDLVIFDDGKRVFPKKAAQSQPFSKAPPNSDKERASAKSKNQETPVIVSEDVAEQHLLDRVEPDYPEFAREQRLQGTVILSVNVGKDGAVHSLSRVAGDSQLTLIAAKAVRQWRFSPLVRDGAPIDFESQVTLSFVLP
jgi:TonB family protein